MNGYVCIYSYYNIHTWTDEQIPVYAVFVADKKNEQNKKKIGIGARLKPKAYIILYSGMEYILLYCVHLRRNKKQRW